MPSRFRQPSLPVLPLPVTGALIYVGVLSLKLVFFNSLFPPGVKVFSYELVWFALQQSSEAHSSLRWTSCLVSLLLVGFLWLSWRCTDRSLFTTGTYLGTAVLVLFCHLALMSTLQAIPDFGLLPLG
ncbi:MAG: hypothetical protein AAGN46_01825 [Acidobacteriota bacterium]